MSDKKTVIAIENTYEAVLAIVNNRFPDFKMEDIYFIKTSDLGEWAKNNKAFIFKSFGDRLSNYFINFIYKDGDEDLEAKKLEFELKSALFLKGLKRNKHD